MIGPISYWRTSSRCIGALALTMLSMAALATIVGSDRVKRELGETNPRAWPLNKASGTAAAC